jgi:GDP/UDP-N,N'-diacetylbacillosamine 2-epimerase (hydrolysing)
MKIAVLTSSRADYGILTPLLKELRNEHFFDLHIIAFGSHLSSIHGRTIDLLFKDGFEVNYQFSSMPKSDLPGDISRSISETITFFVPIWKKENYEMIIVLGDRFEIFAACVSSIPYNIKIAHLHGGETTLGAFDDAFRNSISHMSYLHFVAAEQYRKRVVELTQKEDKVFNVGALSIDNLKAINLLSKEDFLKLYKINLDNHTILVTFHPETIEFHKNEYYISELIDAMSEFNNYQLVITMPNADTMGNMIRMKLEAFINKSNNAFKIETFGTLGYLSCMKHSTMMLGNTSSGFIEASFFPKYVINIGERQTGRIITKNIINIPIDKNKIIQAVNDFENFKLNEYEMIYGNGDTAKKIINILKSEKC